MNGLSINGLIVSAVLYYVAWRVAKWQGIALVFATSLIGTLNLAEWLKKQ